MVGFKTFWIAISALFLLGACVPQTKQSSCGTNEAFNSQLRTCVPIVGGAESFVTVKDFVPASVVSKSQSDYTDTTLSITVANPYNQTYTVQWERIFNGSSVPMTPVAGSQGLAVVINPGQIVAWYNQIGTHIVTAKIFVGTKQVDSHNFTVQINQNPKPTIIAPIVPDPGAGVTFTPADSAQTFSFSIRNNIGLDLTHNWTTRWTVTKNNATFTTETDAFTNFGAADTNFPSLTFNPSTAGIGNYTVRAIVSNNPPSPYVQEVVDERLWIVTVKHPEIGVINTVHTPLQGTQTVAFHDVSYDVWGFRTGVAASTTKGQYCVQVSKPEGAYIDGSAQDPTSNGIVVRYYKDGGSSPIFEGFTSTSPLKNTVCFSEAVAEQANLFFNDGSATTPYYKTLKARVFDVQTGLEMCVDGATCPVTYPVSWSILVRPKNTPPVMRILASAGAGDLISYPSPPTSSTTTISATVEQDKNFTVRFSIADLAGEYDTSDPLHTDKYKYTAILKQGTTTLTHSCVKDFSDSIVGPNYACVLNIPSNNGLVPIAPLPHTLTIQAEDLNSPVPGSVGQLSNILTWNLTVTESNTQPSIALTNILDASNAPVASPLEGSTIKFQLAISDIELDRYNLTIYKCANAGCTGSLGTFAGNSVTMDSTMPQYSNNYSISYPILENEIGNVPSGTIYFKAVVTDIPHTPLLALSNEIIIPVNITEFNAPPVISTASLTAPAVNNVTAYNVMSGNPLSISTVGAVTDASSPASGEGNLTYQWWISVQSSGAWTKIDGATSSTLKWTPGPEINQAVNHQITFCVTDGSYARPDVDPAVPGSICSSQHYLVKGRTNFAGLSTHASMNGEVAVHHVPSERTTYIAYARNGGVDATVYVRKLTYGLNGVLDNSGMSEVSFIASTGASTVKDLSITSTDNSVLVAYLSDETTSPGSFKTRIRRININNTTEGSKAGTDYTASTRKFNFTNGALSVGRNCTTTTDVNNCQIIGSGRVIRFNGSANDVGTGVTINGVLIAASVASPLGQNEMCSNCNAAGQASSLASAINNSNDDGLQGVTATYSGSDVTIYGQETTNVFDSAQTASGLGKIVSTASHWYLPVINSGLPGANQNRIQILHSADGDLSSIDQSVIVLEKASSVDNGLTASGNLLIAYTTLAGSVSKIALLDNTFGTSIGPVTLFSGNAITDIKVRPSPGAANPNVFVVAKNVSGQYHLARLPASLGTTGVQGLMTTFADTTDSNNSTILGSSILDVDVQPALPLSPATSTNEARLVVTSDAGSGTFNSYMFRWKQIAGSPYEALDVAEGEFFDKSTDAVATYSKIGTAPISMVTIGDSGSVVSDKTNALLPVIRVKSNNQAEFGFLNTEIETIHSDTRSSTGLFRPALVR